MPDFTALLSRFFKSDNFRDGPRTLTIRSVTKEKVGRDDDGGAFKPVLWFEEDERGLTLNSTRYETCAQLFGGNNTDSWLGKRIQAVYDPTTKFGGKRVGGIALRAPQ